MQFDYSWRCECERGEGSAPTKKQAENDAYESMSAKKCCRVATVSQHERGGDLTGKDYKVFNNSKF